MKIEKKLKEWLGQGFINAQQAEQILQFEETSGRARSSNRGLYAFLILGASVIALGVISLIAANWDYIPAAVKLAATFAMLIGLAAAIYRAQLREHVVAFDVLSTFFVLWCLATIGLIAQIFHTGGQPYQALSFWLVITFALAVLGKKQFLPNLWVTGLLATFLTWALTDESWWARQFLSQDSSYSHIADNNIFPLFLTVAMGMFLLENLSARMPKLLRFSRPTHFFGLAASLAVMVAGDIYFIFHEPVGRNALYPVYFLLPLTLSTLMVRPELERSAKILLSLFLGLALCIYIPSAIRQVPDYGAMEDTYQFWGAAYFIASAVLLALYFAVRKNFRMFNLMTTVIGVRFLIVYFQVVEDLAATGFGLMFSGLLIIGFTVGWYKSRHRLETWARSLFV